MTTLSNMTKLSALVTACLATLLFAMAIAVFLLVPSVGNNLGMTIISGLVILIVALAGLAALLASTALSQHREALALPPGSVRALLAFGLLIIFAGFGAYIMGGSPVTTNERLDTGDKLNNVQNADDVVHALHESRLIAIQVHRVDKDSKPQTDVVVFSPSKWSEIGDLVKQLLTMLSTLLVTVVGFYFGSRATNAGATPKPNTGGPEGEAAGKTEAAPDDKKPQAPTDNPVITAVRAAAAAVPSLRAQIQADNGLIKDILAKPGTTLTDAQKVAAAGVDTTVAASEARIQTIQSKAQDIEQIAADPARLAAAGQSLDVVRTAVDKALTDLKTAAATIAKLRADLQQTTAEG